MQELTGAQVCAPTLRRVWSDYKVSRTLREATLRNYNQRLTTYLGDWLDLPVNQITKDMVEQRHREINGNAMANSTMRTLKSLLHYAARKYENENGDPILKTNPVYRLSELRVWKKERRRQTLIRIQELRPWFEAVLTLENHTSRDFFLLLMFTGMRKGEALNLRWSNVNLSTGIITLPPESTKTHEEYVIPLSDYVWTLLRVRHFYATSDFVFPGAGGARPLSGAFNSYSTVSERSGVKFSPHDLRRTFITIADELDIKSEVVKALVNHAQNDVTEGYTIRSVERLRRATQKITDAILQYGGMRKSPLIGT